MAPFRRILIANRGEIALRVMRTAHALGYGTVPVYSDADRDAPHARRADLAVPIGPAQASDSYLSVPRLIEAARLAGADAVHPGYGFLAESAAFARACAEAGLTFIGPPANTIALMGNKRAAKDRMIEAGVPVIDGYHGADQSDERLIAEAARIGAPVMVKAAAGGGGRGMRLVDDLAALPAALVAARAEARAAFGEDELILECALSGARHIEVQVFADSHGTVVHLGERHCSIQRRHQKIVEETRAPGLSAETHAALCETAVTTARAIDYVGAGTVEFLLDRAGRVHFMEMNTCLQVEHGITEMVAGVDLVALQIAIAAGEALVLAQDEIRLDGHAIEARLYAEDPARGFLPQSGPVHLWAPPAGTDGIRVDHALRSGAVIGAHYDPMIAKVMAHGRTPRALGDCTLLGPITNKRFLMDVLDHPAFAAGEVSVEFVARHFAPGSLEAPAPDHQVLALGAALHALHADPPQRDSLGGGSWPTTLACAGTEYYVNVVADGARIGVTNAGGEAEIELVEHGESHVAFLAGGLRRRARFVFAGNDVHLDVDGCCFVLTDVPLGQAVAAAPGGDSAGVAPMHGRLVAIHVLPGARVTKGEALATVEAMKMQHVVTAGRDGVVAAVEAAVGDQLVAGAAIVTLAPPALDGGETD
jgi:geranyl-CoA carboxylase alpha subunit